MLVSHDREFLARCVTRVVELDLAQHQVAVYDGGYDAYLEERAVARRHAREAYEEFADTQGRPRRAGPHPARVELAGRAQRDAKSPDNDKIRRKAQHRVLGEAGPEGAPDGVADRPARRGRGAAQGVGAAVQHRGRAALELGGRHPQRGDRSRRGDFTLGPVSLQVNAGDRIGITGPNGAGKTTLLRLLLGRLAPDDRHAPASAPRVAVGEIDQARTGLAGGPAARRRLRGGRAGADAGRRPHPAGEVRRSRPTRSTSPVGRLSPGERTRAALALLQARGVNLLVLDEPTNHLDLPAIEQLEQALDGYDGALLLVSHDRRLLDNVRLDQRWHVEGGRVSVR